MLWCEHRVNSALIAFGSLVLEVVPKNGGFGYHREMNIIKPRILCVEAVDDLPVLWATLLRLNLLRVMTAITVSVVAINGQTHALLSPLTEVQKHLLELWGLPADLYEKVARGFPKPTLDKSEP